MRQGPGDQFSRFLPKIEGLQKRADVGSAPPLSPPLRVSARVRRGVGLLQGARFLAAVVAVCDRFGSRTVTWRRYAAPPASLNNLSARAFCSLCEWGGGGLVRPPPRPCGRVHRVRPRAHRRLTRASLISAAAVPHANIDDDDGRTLSPHLRLTTAERDPAHVQGDWHDCGG